MSNVLLLVVIYVKLTNANFQQTIVGSNYKPHVEQKGATQAAKRAA
jgi:hypothetical protein